MTRQPETINEFSVDHVDIAEIEAQARKLRAETLAAFGKKFRMWIKTLDFGFAARTAH